MKEYRVVYEREGDNRQWYEVSHIVQTEAAAWRYLEHVNRMGRCVRNPEIQERPVGRWVSLTALPWDDDGTPYCIDVPVREGLL